MASLRGWSVRQVCRTGLLALCGMFAAQTLAADSYGNSSNVDEFINEMTRDYGFAGDQLKTLFGEAERKDAILEAISRPAERVRPWKEYRPIFITDSRIARGVDFWREHEDALNRAQAEYGVPPEIIVSIIGVETFYGGNTGRYRVVDALSTLAFDYPPRSPFFRKELREFLLLVREQQVDPLTLKGSYAGAMGLPQFMPSSFRAYAVDFDGDGHINIWTNPTDAIGSVASYFKAHGWKADAPVAVRATVKGDYEKGLTEGLESTLTMGELRKLGWSTESPVADDVAITAFRLEGAKGDEYWVGLPNFYVISRYNRSVMYSMAVNQLAELLAKAKGAR